MASKKVTDKTKQTLKSVKELLEKAEDSTHKAITKAAPKVQKSLDTSMESAGKAFNSTMKTIEGATVEDQIRLLRAYRKFLGGQADFVDSRIAKLGSKSQEKKSE